MELTIDDRYPGPTAMRSAHIEERVQRLEDDLGRPLLAVVFGLEEGELSRFRVRMTIHLTTTRQLEVSVSRRRLPDALDEAFDVALIRLRTMGMRETRAPVLPVRGLPSVRVTRRSPAMFLRG